MNRQNGKNYKCQSGYRENKDKRKHFRIMFSMVIFLICFVLILFRAKPEVLIPVLTGLGGLISGFVGGRGLK
jgi:uncharacterized membrane protein (DUF485 family)